MLYSLTSFNNTQTHHEDRMGILSTLQLPCHDYVWIFSQFRADGSRRKPPPSTMHGWLAKMRGTLLGNETLRSKVIFDLTPAFDNPISYLFLSRVCKKWITLEKSANRSEKGGGVSEVVEVCSVSLVTERSHQRHQEMQVEGMLMEVADQIDWLHDLLRLGNHQIHKAHKGPQLLQGQAMRVVPAEEANPAPRFQEDQPVADGYLYY